MKMLSALAIIALNVFGAAAQNSSASSPKLAGTWACSTGSEEGDARMRVLSEVVFDVSGTRSMKGSMLWSKEESAMRANFTSVSDAALRDDTLVTILISIDVEVTDVSGPLANIPDTAVSLKKGIETDLKNAPQQVSDVLELTHERLITKARDNGAMNTCVRKG